MLLYTLYTVYMSRRWRPPLAHRCRTKLDWIRWRFGLPDSVSQIQLAGFKWSGSNGQIQLVSFNSSVSIYGIQFAGFNSPPRASPSSSVINQVCGRYTVTQFSSSPLAAPRNGEHISRSSHTEWLTWKASQCEVHIESCTSKRWTLKVKHRERHTDGWTL